MNRHYYLSDDLNDLEKVETELEASGIDTEQIHVLSERDADVERHHLHDVSSLMKERNPRRLDPLPVPRRLAAGLLHLGRQPVRHADAQRRIQTLRAAPA